MLAGGLFAHRPVTGSDADSGLLIGFWFGLAPTVTAASIAGLRSCLAAGKWRQVRGACIELRAA
jgi:hypothetical protein|tara:strand:+ start:9757 stop:9948 length:192 start_codon:yes stop_codon:yes gene_type:complete